MATIRDGSKTGCFTREEITTNGGEIILNANGSVSVFYNNPTMDGLTPFPLTLACCKVLDPSYNFDIDTQTCRWSNAVSCGFNEPINLIINTKGNDGTLFYVDEAEKEVCDLKISFDYLLKIKCEDLLDIVNPTIITNPQSQETLNQINLLQIEISEINTQIEALTTNIYNLNGVYNLSYYSISCDIPCLKADTIGIILYYSIENTNFRDNYALACAAAQYANSHTSWNSLNTIGYVTTPFTIGSSIYLNDIVNDCTYKQNGYYVISYFENNITSYKVLTLTNGLITSIDDCVTGKISNDKLSVFDNSGFNKAATDLTPNSVNSSTTPVLLCITPFGLNIWNNILGDINYNEFILGNPDSYTCDDVVALLQQQQSECQNNGQCYAFDCTIPFGYKSNLLVQINTQLEQLTELNHNLTIHQNNLIELQGFLETSTTLNKGCKTPIEALESIDIEMHLDVVGENDSIISVFSAATFQAINLTSNLYNYLTTNTNSGFYICGDPSSDNIGLSDCTTLSLNNGTSTTPNVDSCDLVLDSLMTSLYEEYGTNGTYDAFKATLNDKAFASNWLKYSTIISDPNIINLITNKKIKISFKVKFSCVDFCFLIDNIVLDKSCTSVDKTEIIIPQSPGFNFQRVIDNKKSWSDTRTSTERLFHVAKFDETNPIRQTDYNVNDERLVLNTKEIDLDISLASAIETDVWCFLNDNPNLFTGYTSTSCTSCQVYEVDLHNLVTQSISAITTIEGFENFMVSEFIDAKNRQTITSYATLRAIYERYLNSSYYVGNISSAFTYESMDKFAGLVGNYWIDLIEQVVPSTTIWGSVKIYTNTIFDEQKFKYKSYTTLIDKNPFVGEHVLSPINGVSGETAYPNVIWKTLATNKIIKTRSPKFSYSDVVFVAQMNSGSEFIGSVEITPKILSN